MTGYKFPLLGVALFMMAIGCCHGGAFVMVGQNTSANATPMPGGWQPVDVNDASLTKAISVATSYFSTEGITSCNSVAPSEAYSQVVNGWNFKFVFTIPASCSPDNTETTCTIVIYQANQSETPKETSNICS